MRDMRCREFISSKNLRIECGKGCHVLSLKAGECSIYTRAYVIYTRACMTSAIELLVFKETKQPVSWLPYNWESFNRLSALAATHCIILALRTSSATEYFLIDKVVLLAVYIIEVSKDNSTKRICSTTIKNYLTSFFSSNSNRSRAIRHLLPFLLFSTVIS